MLIQIRDDIFGEYFRMVDAHEGKHLVNENMSEPDVRFWTDALQLFGYSNKDFSKRF